MKIYVFGNPLVKKDHLPLKLTDALRSLFPDLDFIVTDPNENFPPEGERDLIVLDTVLGIKNPMMLDLSDLESSKKTPITPHDYGLLLHLFLLKKLRRIESVKIIGIPVGKSQEEVLEATAHLIRLLPLNLQKMGGTAHTRIKSPN